MSLARGVHPLDLEARLAQPLAADAVRIGVVGVDDRLVPRERGGAANHSQRVAVGEHQAGIGKHVEQRGQVHHVLRALEHPRAQARDLLRPADQLEQPRHLAIGGRRIGRFAPAAVTGDPPLRIVLHAPEAVHEQAELLLGFERPGRVDAQRARVGQAGDAQDARGEGDAEVGPAGFEPGARHRADGLEAAQVAEAVVGGDQAVHARGARAHRADHDHRVRQRAREDLRMAREPLLGAQPVVQHLLELRARRPFAGGIEPRVGVKRSRAARRAGARTSGRRSRRARCSRRRGPAARPSRAPGVRPAAPCARAASRRSRRR